MAIDFHGNQLKWNGQYVTDDQLVRVGSPRKALHEKQTTVFHHVVHSTVYRHGRMAFLYTLRLIENNDFLV